ncbi:MAG: hypothetical protein P8182_13545, partial [Deltaproteobacteria bacterium]
MRSEYVTNIEGLNGLTSSERTELGRVAERFRFQAHEYYLSLIDWSDPEDPIRRVVVPSLEELSRRITCRGFEDVRENAREDWARSCCRS